MANKNKNQKQTEKKKEEKIEQTHKMIERIKE